MANLLYCCKGSKKAFTLAELLVSVLIISIVMVVLAPVLTKRFVGSSSVGQVSGGGVSGSNSDYRLFLFDASDPLCSAISGVTNAVECDFTAPEGVQLINAVLVSGGGGGAGATNPTYEVGKKSYTTSGKEEVKITNGMKNVTITYLSGGGGGGGGGAYVQQSSGGAPKEESDCTPYHAKLLTSTWNGGKAVCVLKYNVGDIPNVSRGGLASSVTAVAPNVTCAADDCCWTGGKTAGSCDTSGVSYSGCNRTVCTWKAANNSCNSLAFNGTKAGDWRLPTKNELDKWSVYMAYINTNRGDNGLRLCGDDSGFGAPSCSYSSVCVGSVGSCFPSNVWSSSASGSKYYNYFLDGIYFNGPYTYAPRYALSAAVSWRVYLQPLTLSPAAEAAAEPPELLRVQMQKTEIQAVLLT